MERRGQMGEIWGQNEQCQVPDRMDWGGVGDRPQLCGGAIHRGGEHVRRSSVIWRFSVFVTTQHLSCTHVCMATALCDSVSASQKHPFMHLQKPKATKLYIKRGSCQRSFKALSKGYQGLRELCFVTKRESVCSRQLHVKIGSRQRSDSAVRDIGRNNAIWEKF